MTVVTVIPARGGSKGIHNKNLVVLCERPLIAYSIDAARAATTIDQVIVSTDDSEIADVACSLGAQVPFMRPAELAQDTSPMLGVLEHALAWSEAAWGPIEAIVLLQPTSPLREARHIDEAVALFRSSAASSVVSVVEVPHQFNPISVMTLHEGVLRPFLDADKPVLRRQDKPLVFARNGPAVLVCAPDTLRSGELYGARCAPYVMTSRDSLDIDSYEDLELANFLKQRSRP